MFKLLCWQKNGSTVITCDCEIKIRNLRPGRALWEAQGKDNAIKPYQHIGLKSLAQAHKLKESVTRRFSLRDQPAHSVTGLI